MTADWAGLPDDPLAVELDWLGRFIAGGIVCKQAEPGERVAAVLPDAAVCRVSLAPDLALGTAIAVDEVLARGTVLVSDRRVAVFSSVEGSALCLERRWAESAIETVVAAIEGAAVVVPARSLPVPAPWAVVSPSRLVVPPASPASRAMEWNVWNRVSAGWHASQGQLDVWLSRTVGLLRAAG